MRTPTWLLLGLAMTALSAADAARAEEPILYTVTYVEVMPPSTVQGAALLREYREASRKDEGHVRVEVLQRIDRPNQFAILAVWKSAKAFEAHSAAAVAGDVRARLQPLQASPNDERLHNALAVGPASAADAGDVLFAVTHVDVVPPRKDDSLPLLAQLAATARSETGNVRFDVMQQVNRPNHFTVVEAWRDMAAFDAHGMAAPTRRFRQELAPMSGALYDERLYRALR